jgi:hypothetical protein
MQLNNLIRRIMCVGTMLAAICSTPAFGQSRYVFTPVSDAWTDLSNDAHILSFVFDPDTGGTYTIFSKKMEARSASTSQAGLIRPHWESTTKMRSLER